MEIIKGVLGYIAVIGYMLFESIFFGIPVWLCWNVTIPHMFTNVQPIVYIQGVALVVFYKAITFHISKINISPEK